MPSIQDTAYPRFKKHIKQRELDEIYTPTSEEIKFVRTKTRNNDTYFYFFILLKTFQRLGYFAKLTHIPTKITCHIAQKLKIADIPDVSTYDNSQMRHRFMLIIRSYLNIKPYNDESIAIIENTVKDAAFVKEDLSDIINVVIEELVKQRHELPGFSTLCKFAADGRVKVNKQLCKAITSHNLTEKDKLLIDKLFIVDKEQDKSPWYFLKKESKNVTFKNIKERIDYLKWIEQYAPCTDVLVNIPDVKIKQFSSEAKTTDAHKMKNMKPYKRYALAITLITIQKAAALGDLGEMMIKAIIKIHHKGQNELNQKIEQNRERTDSLIDTLHQVLLVHQEFATPEERNRAIDNIIGEKRVQLIKNCEEHALYAGNNYLPFLWKYHSSYRGLLFNILNSIQIISTTKEDSLIKAVNFIKDKRKNKKSIIDIDDISRQFIYSSWVSERWKKAIIAQTSNDGCPDKVYRRYFEICTFHSLIQGLKSGDICIEGSDKFSDYRKQLVSWEEYNKQIDEYGEQVNLPIGKSAFVSHVRSLLETVTDKVDNSFPKNEFSKIEDGKPVLKKSKKRPEIKGLRDFEAKIAERLKPVTLLDVLNITQQWMKWDSCFGPLSGFDTKLKNPVLHYIVTMFCYGCNLGPMQTAKSIKDFNRYQISFINQNHITEAKLDEAIVKIINAYNLFNLPKIWGTGESASVDGKMWDLYESNLLSEYHIRYGGYGGIGYYHISDQYIALFSNFIPCGVHESIYMIDGLINNKSDIQPDTIHGDTHSQSESVYGLSYLLGIKLMPRIKKWKHLTFYKSKKNLIYKHIEELFSDDINWNLIKTYLPDMLRIALSIKCGRITASAILRRLGTYSRKNKLYMAFRELGRVVRTTFLLEYLDDKELRELIQAATCKSETFNSFADWLLFGGQGIIAQNSRDEQRKLIKYNHFIANCLSLYNIVNLTKVINDLVEDNYPVTLEMVEALSPYITSHVNRFGDYHLDFERDTSEMIYNLNLPDIVN